MSFCFLFDCKVGDSLQVESMKKGDGLSMKKALTVDFSGIVDPMVNVTCLYESSDGKLWIGIDDGYLCYDLSDGKFIKEKDRSGMVMSIRESPIGEIWISTKTEGLYCLSKSSIYSRRYPSLKGITDMAFVGNSIWLSSESGKLMSLNPKSNMVSDISEKYGIGKGRIISLHNDEDNHIWVVSPSKVVKFVCLHSQSQLMALSANFF